MTFKNMNSEEKRNWIEVFIGGIFGLLAIIAAVTEYFLGDEGALAGMFKDIFGTAVVVVILFTAMPKRKPKNLAKQLEIAVEKWGENNAPLIFKTEDYRAAQNTNFTQGFKLLQNPKKDYIPLIIQNISKNTPEWSRYAKYRTDSTGKFLDMPDYKEMTENDFHLSICLEQTHFKQMPEIDSIMKELTSAIQSVGKKISAKRVGSSQTIEVSYSRIESKDDIVAFVDSLDYILSLIKVII